MDNNNDSGVNTVLIVFILLIIVGFGVWWFTMREGAPIAQTTPQDIKIDVKLPTPDTTTQPATE